MFRTQRRQSGGTPGKILCSEKRCLLQRQTWHPVWKEWKSLKSRWYQLIGDCCICLTLWSLPVSPCFWHSSKMLLHNWKQSCLKKIFKRTKILLVHSGNWSSSGSVRRCWSNTRISSAIAPSRYNYVVRVSLISWEICVERCSRVLCCWSSNLDKQLENCTVFIKCLKFTLNASVSVLSDQPMEQ